MSADELRQAAVTLRQRAEAATGRLWSFNTSFEDDLHDDAAGWVGYDAAGDGYQQYICSTANHLDGIADGAYIATMHPGVGIALADLMEWAASEHEGDGPEGCYECDRWLPLARLINGGE